jgi:hypothetical protein
MGGPMETMEENRAKKCLELWLFYKRVKEVDRFQEKCGF